MKKMVNKTHIEGYLYESTIEEKVAGSDAKNPGSKYINGKISVEESENNVITVDIFESEYTKAGTKNKKYDTLKAIMDANSIVTIGRDTAAKIRMDSALSINDFYRNDGELVSFLRNFNGFIHLVTDNKFTPSATFETDMLITSVTDEMVKAEDGTMEPSGALLVNGYIFDYNNNVMPAVYTVENPNGIKYFRDLEPNTFTKVWGNMITQTITNTKIEESAWGDDKVVEYTNTKKKFVITGTNKEPYAFGEDDVLSVAQMQEAVATRQVYLAELKSKTEESRKKAGTATSGSVNINKSAQEFKF